MGGWKDTKYEEDLAFKLFIKYCGKNMLARQLLIAPVTMVSSLKVKRNVTRCGEPAFTAYEMY